MKHSLSARVLGGWCPCLLLIVGLTGCARTFEEEWFARPFTPGTYDISFGQFRKNVQSYRSPLRPGNTLAAPAAGPAFTSYLAAFHRNLHLSFTEGGIVEAEKTGSFADGSLVTKLEIAIEPNGEIGAMGIVESSGNLTYDFHAYRSVWRGMPYPPPMPQIRSPDGRTYLRWSLHRNESGCGVWNAEPYILRSVRPGLP